MKITALVLVLLSWCLFCEPVSSASTNPIRTVLELISGLQQEVIKEGQQDHNIYNQFAEMCSDNSRKLHHEIKSGKEYAAQLTATIEKATAKVAVEEAKISDMAEGTADAEADLQKAIAMRRKESVDFHAGEKELLKTISTIERAITIIEREGPGASFAQVEDMQSITQVLQAMVEASMVDSYNAATLTELVQSSVGKPGSTSEDTDEDDTGAPSAATYEAKSRPIMDTLASLLDKSKHQLDEERQAESQAQNAYALVKQSLDNKVHTITEGMAAVKKDLAATKESRAAADGDLTVTKKDLGADLQDLERLHHECLDRATSFQDAATSRDGELQALSSAKIAIMESTGSAAKQTYQAEQTSFLQLGSEGMSDDTLSKTSDALHIVRNLGLSLHSPALMEFSNHMKDAILHSASPFGKVRNLVNSMISKLQTEADSAATKKAYCDQEMKETETSQEHKGDSLEQLRIQIDVMKASSRKLKERVGVLKNELGDLAKSQAEMLQVRAREKTTYDKNKPEMEQGLEGIKQALVILREYYANDEKSHNAAEGAGSGLVAMLEVIESDFAKGIAEMTTQEDSSQSEFAKVSKANQVLRAEKEQGAKHQIAEYVALDKSMSELEADKSGAEEELSAVVQYATSIKKECVALPDAYEERKQKREQEIAGLHEALEALQSEGTMLLQRSTTHKTLRGATLLAASR